MKRVCILMTYKELCEGFFKPVSLLGSNIEIQQTSDDRKHEVIRIFMNTDCHYLQDRQIVEGVDIIVTKSIPTELEARFCLNNGSFGPPPKFF